MPGISTQLEVSNSLVSKLDTMMGLSLDVGFDQTRHTEMGWGEFWLRTHLNTHYAENKLQLGQVNPTGADTDGDTIQWVMIHTHAGPELKIYLFPMVDLVAGIAGGGSFLLGISDRKIKQKASHNAFEEGEDATDLAMGYTLGAIGDVGLDVVFHPDWSLRLGLQYRYNFMEIELSGPNHEDGSKNQTSTFYGPAAYQNLGTLSGVNALGESRIFSKPHYAFFSGSRSGAQSTAPSGIGVHTPVRRFGFTERSERGTKGDEVLQHIEYTSRR